MKARVLTAMISLASAIVIAPAQAQDETEAQKRENVMYYTMNLVDFKAGANDEAWEIIYDHFVPVDNAVGREIINFDYHSGGWDHIVFFPMGETTDELEWSRSPADVAWWSALIEQEGGKDQADALMKRYNGLVARSSRHIVHRHMDANQ